MSTWVLILFLATGDYRAGAAGISQEFYSKQTCQSAGQALANDAASKGRSVLTWGCFPK